jgi:hypothetical protein
MSNNEHASYCDMGCTDGDCSLQQCRECGEDWPCEVTQLRAAIARVEALAGRYDKVADACMMNSDRELIRSAAFDIRAALKDGA